MVRQRRARRPRRPVAGAVAAVAVSPERASGCGSRNDCFKSALKLCTAILHVRRTRHRHFVIAPASSTMAAAATAAGSATADMDSSNPVLPKSVLDAAASLPSRPDPATLVGPNITLRPYVEADAADLFAAANGTEWNGHPAYEGNLVWRYMCVGVVHAWQAGARVHASAADIRFRVCQTPRRRADDSRAFVCSVVTTSGHMALYGYWLLSLGCPR